MTEKPLNDGAEYIEKVKFRKRFLGGVDEADVWRKLEKFAASKDTEASKSAVKARRRRLRDKADIIRFAAKLTAFVIIIWILFGLVFGIKIAGDMSMHPRISPRDVTIFYRLQQQHDIGDVVMYEKDGNSYFGRIVARPGDSVDISGDKGLRINDSVVSENDIFYMTKPYDVKLKYPVKLGENEYFILADYREGSKDSRYFGAINQKEIKGDIIAVIRKSGF